MRIIFAGSPAFAVPSLRALVESKHEIVAVVTQPARPAGRGLQLADPPVKQCASMLGLKVLQPVKFNAPDFLDLLSALEPDLIITAAYGRIFKARALGLPRLGCVNLHASLLPKYRGVAPANWAVIKGETLTGVTAFFMDEGVDTGDMIGSCATEIGANETAGELLERLSMLGADLVGETCGLIESGSVTRLKQDNASASYAPRLSKQDGKIAWERHAGAVHNHIRGVNPWPGAFCAFRGQMLKILASRLNEETGPYSQSTQQSVTAGAVIAIDSAGGILVSCNGGSVWLLTVQAQGKKAIASADFARGYRIKVGERFG